MSSFQFLRDRRKVDFDINQLVYTPTHVIYSRTAPESTVDKRVAPIIMTGSAILIIFLWSHFSHKKKLSTFAASNLECKKRMKTGRFTHGNSIISNTNAKESLLAMLTSPYKYFHNQIVSAAIALSELIYWRYHLTHCVPDTCSLYLSVNS